MYRILPFIHLFTVLLFSQEYYGKIVDLGEISEAGTDIIIYYEDDKVRAFLRNYTNMYGNKYFHLFGKDLLTIVRLNYIVSFLVRDL